MTRRRSIGAYGVCGDGAGRVLLVRSSPRSPRHPAGTWMLPGGRIGHGEHPEHAVIREAAEETGLVVTVRRVREVAAEVVHPPAGPEHTDGVIYDLAVAGGTLRPEVDGSSDRARWVAPAEAARWPLSRFVSRALGLPDPAPPAPAGSAPAGSAPAGSAPAGSAPAESAPGPAPRPRQGQRFGVYGLVTDPAGRVLLTRNAAGYPGAGRWHLPGGGTDFGEQPYDALLREITEESGQAGRIRRLQTVVHRHNRAAVGPEGYPIDWHAVAAVFEVAVTDPTVPRVLDPGGSTAAAAWFSRTEQADLPLTDLAAALLAYDR